MTHLLQTIDTPDGPFTAVTGEDGAVLASGLGLPIAFALVGAPVLITAGALLLKGRIAPQPGQAPAPVRPPVAPALQKS